MTEDDFYATLNLAYDDTFLEAHNPMLTSMHSRVITIESINSRFDTFLPFFENPLNNGLLLQLKEIYVAVAQGNMDLLRLSRIMQVQLIIDWNRLHIAAQQSTTSNNVGDVLTPLTIEIAEEPNLLYEILFPNLDNENNQPHEGILTTTTN